MILPPDDWERWCCQVMTAADAEKTPARQLD
jgi:hypothetical protein